MPKEKSKYDGLKTQYGSYTSEAAAELNYLEGVYYRTPSQTRRAGYLRGLKADAEKQAAANKAAEEEKQNTQNALNTYKFRQESELGSSQKENHYGKKQTPEKFYEIYYPKVAKALEGTNVSPELAMAQLAIETGWGRTINSENGFAAVFGKKHGSKEDGKYAEIQTVEDISEDKIQEYIDKNRDKLVLTDTPNQYNQNYKVGDKYVDLNMHEYTNRPGEQYKEPKLRVKIRDNFSAYDSFEDAIKGYAELLTTNDNYKNNFYAAGDGLDPIAQARGIAPKYATSAGYADDLISIINTSREKGRLAGGKMAVSGAKNEAFIERNPDGTATYYTKAGPDALKLNEDGVYDYGKWNDPNNKYFGYYQAPFTLPDNHQLINAGDYQYIVSPGTTDNPNGQLFRVDEAQQQAKSWNSYNTNFDLSNKVGVSDLTSWASGSDKAGSPAAALLREANEYANEHNLDKKDGDWSQEEFDGIKKFRNLMNVYKSNPQYRDDDLAEQEYAFNKRVMVPFYKKQLNEVVDWSQQRVNNVENELLQAVANDAPDDVIAEIRGRRDQVQYDYEQTKLATNQMIKGIDDAVAPEKRTPSSYGGFEEMVMSFENWLSPGAVGIQYNVDQEGNKLIGTSDEEKSEFLANFDATLKPFFNAAVDRNNERIENWNAAQNQPQNTSVIDPNNPYQGQNPNTNNTNRTNTGVSYGTSGYGYQPKINEANFNPNMDYINDLGTVAEVTDDGEVVRKEKTLKELQNEMADVTASLETASTPIEQVGVYAPDLESDDNIGGFLGDAGRALVGIRGATEQVPEYQTGSMYNLAMDEMTARRNLGMSDEEIAQMRNLAERGYGYDVKNIRRLSGGSAGVALGNLGRAQNQLYDQYTNIAAADQRVRQANRAQFYQGAMTDENVNRQKFQDELQQVLMNKQAGAGLVNDALSNIDDRIQFNKFYGKGSPYYEMKKSTWLSSEQERIDKEEALKNSRQKHIDDLTKQQRDLQAQIDEKQTYDVNTPLTLANQDDDKTTASGEALLNSVTNNIPFTTQEEGDAFRTYMQKNHPDWTADDGEKLDPIGGYDNKWINQAKQEFGKEYEGYQDEVAAQAEKTQTGANEDGFFNVSSEDGFQPKGDPAEIEMYNKLVNEQGMEPMKALTEIRNQRRGDEVEEEVTTVEEEPKTDFTFEEWKAKYPDGTREEYDNRPPSNYNEIVEETKPADLTGNVFDMSAADVGYSPEDFPDDQDEKFNIYGITENTWNGMDEDTKQTIIEQGPAKKEVAEPGTSLVESTEEGAAEAADAIENVLKQGGTTEDAEAIADEYVATGETTEPVYSNSAVNEGGELVFNFNGKEVKESDFADPPLENKNDGQDYLRNIHNEEAAFGSFSGTGVGNYGYTGTGAKGKALLGYFNQAEGDKAQKALTTTNKYIIGEDGQDKLNGGNTTILQDLKMSRKDFDLLPDDVKSELVNWKLNTGRGTTDLVMIAGGGDWDGKRAFNDPSPTADKIKNIDLSKLTKEDLKAARQELYKGRIDGLEAIWDGYSERLDNDDYGDEGLHALLAKYEKALANWEEAHKGYENSQKYR